MNKLPRIMLLQLLFFITTTPVLATFHATPKEIANQTAILRMFSIMLSCQAFICCVQAKESSSKIMFAGGGVALIYAGLGGTHPFEHQSSN